MTAIEIGDVMVSGATGGKSIAGDGPLVVLVHGAGMDRTVWSLQTRWLAYHGCQTIAIDLPGHGASAEPERSSIDDYADWLAALVQASGRPVHVVGHSMGTFIALEAAVRTAVASLTLIGTAAGMPVHPTLLEAAKNGDPLAAQLMSGWAFAHETRTGPHPSPGSSMVGATQAMIGQSRALGNDLEMCSIYEGAVAAAAALEAPLTLLLGGADRMTPVRSAQPLLDACPDAKVNVVAGIGHMVQIESPDMTRSTIAAALETSNV